ncbi:hypothetical protein [Nitrosospira lacus]|nr:hypothetical protein [Nitrosospira lacus]
MIARKSIVSGITEDELASISLFRERVEKLAASQAKYQNIPICSTSLDAESGKLIFRANTPDVDDILNIAVKFRFFYADKEPTQFEKILTQTRRRISDEWARNYMDRIANLYKVAMKQNDTSNALGHPIENRKIISLWFNSEFFHSALEKRDELRTINEVIGPQASLFQLYTAIVKCSSFIKNLYAVVHKLEAGNEYVYTPNHHFRVED